MDNYYEGITDNESNDSWDETDNETDIYETDDETDIDDISYEPEEISLSKYNLVLCEKYNTLTHGFSAEAKYHYLTHIRFKYLDINIINNYINNTNSINTIKLEIAECIYLPSYHCISIIKTHWLKLIQRVWKKNYRERKLTIMRRCHPNALKYREIHGRWPHYCINYPSLRGMLSNLSRTSSRTIS